MAKELLPDALWKRIEPLIPPEPPKKKGGRPRLSDRKALLGILFLARTGCGWEYIPKELGCGSGMTCWRRLRDWQVAGVWQMIWKVLLDELGMADKIDWSKSVVDSSSVRALFGGAETGPNPTDRGKKGSKMNLICDGQGIPFAVIHSGANVHDSEKAVPLVDAVPAIKIPGGGRRKRPQALLADRAYDAEAKIRKAMRQQKIIPYIAKRRAPNGRGLGKQRWIIESVFSWLFQYRRLRVRYEKRSDIHEAFLTIGCIMICWGKITGFC